MVGRTLGSLLILKVNYANSLITNSFVLKKFLKCLGQSVMLAGSKQNFISNSIVLINYEGNATLFVDSSQFQGDLRPLKRWLSNNGKIFIAGGSGIIAPQ